MRGDRRAFGGEIAAEPLANAAGRAGDGDDLSLEHHARASQYLHGVGDPGDIGAAQMAPIVEGEFA